MEIISQNIKVKISKLVDMYFTENVTNPNKDSDSIFIRNALNRRINEYFPKSLLNEILIKKGFKYKIKDSTNYYYNISLKDIKILSNSKSILDRLSQKSNWNFSDYDRLHKFRNVDLYKYKFKYIIKYKFKSDFIENNYTELDIYNVIAKELGVKVTVAKQYIETFNSHHFQEIPENILSNLLQLFDIEKSESYTNLNG